MKLGWAEEQLTGRVRHLVFEAESYPDQVFLKVLKDMVGKPQAKVTIEAGDHGLTEFSWGPDEQGEDEDGA